MDVLFLQADIPLFCVTARSFPHDIRNAFEVLVERIGGVDNRTFFGISYQDEKGKIIYKAAVAEEYEGEGRELGCENYVLKKGEYLAETIVDWMKDVLSIGAAFREMTEARKDIIFPCVEWYKGKDVTCMIRLK